MTSRDFCFWLQGFLELSDNSSVPSNGVGLSGRQLDCVRSHLALVFKHEIDPSMGGPQKQQTLNEIHNQHLTGIGRTDGLVLRC